MFIQTEATSNPEILRFLPGRPVASSGPVDFSNVEAAIRSPLAQRLFRIEGVTGVVLDSESITVRKNDDKDWQPLRPAILAAIMEHFTAGRPVLLEEASEDATDEAGEDDKVATEIKELIETRIRPAAMETGGDVTFRGYKDGVVYVDMQGSGFSLRDGMINMLRHYVPAVVDVRDYSDTVSKPGLNTQEAAAIQRLLDERINPAVAAHGGHVSLVDVQEDTTYIRLEGGCQGCGMADVTLKQGIETEIKQVVPTIKAVLDVTDHAGGTNPYYQPGKGGASPF